MRESAKRLRTHLGEELPYIAEKGEIILPDGTGADAILTGDTGEKCLVGYAEYRDGAVFALLGDREE